MTSAYPTSLDTLTGKVAALAAELGELPSRNKVMKTFKVGAPKATAALDAVTAAGFAPSAEELPAPRRLHAVPVESDRPDEAVPPAAPVDVPADVPGDVSRPAGFRPDASEVEAVPVVEVGPAVNPATSPVEDAESAAPAGVAKSAARRVRSWPLLLLAAGAFVAIWGGWVGLGELTGFGPIRLLPGIADGFVINSAITLPIGVEAYAAYALRVWLSGATRSVNAKRFAKWSAIGSLVLGALGQVAYHLMVAAGIDTAPWWITTFVSVLPVVVLGCGAALTHLLHDHDTDEVAR